MKNAATVGHRLPAAPAKGRALRRAQRLAREDVVVEGKEAEAEARHELMAVSARGQDHAPRSDLAFRRPHAGLGSLGNKLGHARPLEDTHANPSGFARQAAHELHRVENDRPRIEERAHVAWATDQGSGFVFREHPVVVHPETAGHLEALGEVVALARAQGHVELTGSLEVALDAASLHEGQELLQVLPAQAGQEARFGLAEVGDGQGVRMVEGLGQDPGVPPARPGGRGPSLQEHHVPARVQGLQVERRPEAGEAAAHDRHVGHDVARECLPWLARRAREPEARLLDRARLVSQGPTARS